MIDISHNNGIIDFAKVKAAGHEIVAIKLTQGNGFVDPLGERNWNESAVAGLLRLPYHFNQTGDGAESQADHFLGILHQYGGLRDIDLPPCLDYEDRAGIVRIGTAAATAEAEQWLQLVQQARGRHLVIYLDRSMGTSEVNGQFGQWHLWIADPDAVGKPSVPPQWSDWAFWQTTWRGTVNGITGLHDVDEDTFRFGPDGLAAWVQRTIMPGG